jgi:hypothetical protein
MATESEVLSAAQKMCAADGRGIRATDVIPLGQGYVLVITIPKQLGMSDANWHSVVEDMRSKLQLIPGVERVTLDVTNSV